MGISIFKIKNLILFGGNTSFNAAGSIDLCYERKGFHIYGKYINQLKTSMAVFISCYKYFLFTVISSFYSLWPLYKCIWPLLKPTAKVDTELIYDNF